jgi:hypothetical protein
VSYIVSAAGRKVIETENSMTFAQQTVGEMRSKKPSGSCNEDAHVQDYKLQSSE